MLLALLMGGIGCSTPTEQLAMRPESVNVINVVLEPVDVGLLLPGGYFEIRGQGFLEGATLNVSLTVNAQRYELNARPQSLGVIEAQWPVNLGLSSPAGALIGELEVGVRLADAEGSATTTWRAELAQRLAPQLSTLSAWSAPATERPLSAARMLREGEGQTLLSLEGRLLTESGDVMIAQSVTLTHVDEARQVALWSPDPALWGIMPGQFEGRARLINQAHAGVDEGPVVPVSFSYRSPQLTGPLNASLSRGQRLPLTGWGFLGGDLGGFTLINFTGIFEPLDILKSPRELRDHTLQTTWRSGDELTLTLTPTLDDDCEGDDLGATPGVLIGTLTPSVILGEQQVVGTPLEVEIEVLPTKQVVYLSFLPAFTDSLRLFGLRNVSGRVVDEIIRVLTRDYDGVNLEVRREIPEDFEEFSIVEVGGPDPNAQDLFGLDNTTGLDVCNQRLNDYLAGRNADSGGTFGGVFVESFLNLSPRRGDNPLADPLFDEIFDPIINNPARAGEEGERAAQITRAVKVLGHLVGNTLSHEIGHSLGLPMYPGCGQYHNAPGELQIMDCGRDRPFLERAGLDPRGPAVWTEENKLYLQRILPLR
jgi:hypothetical protein